MPPVEGLLTARAGVQTNIDDYFRDKDLAKVAHNVNMIRRNVLTNRYSGWTKQRSNNFNAGASFLEFAVFADSAGSRTLCFQVGDNLYSYDGATETDMDGTALSTVNPPCIRMFAPYSTGTPTMILCNGVNEPRKYTSTGAGVGAALQMNGANFGAGALVAPLPTRTYSKPKFCEPFLDRMVYAGFDASGSNTAWDILFTNAGTHETCTQSATILATEGGIVTVNPALGPITGIKAFKPINTSNDQILLIGQAQGMSMVVGNGAAGANVFQHLPLTTEFGIYSNRCWMPWGNDLIFLTTDGLRKFSSVASNNTLPQASLTYGVQDIMNRLSPASAKWAHLTHHKIAQEIILWFPLDGGTTNTYALVLNYNFDAPPEQAPFRLFTKDGTSVAAAIDYQNVMYGGGYTGLLQQHYTGNLYDTTPVQWRIDLSMAKPDDPELSAFCDKLTIITQGDAQKFLCNATTYEHRANTLDPETCTPVDFLINEGSSGGTILGSWSLGYSALPFSGIKMHDFEPTGYGRLWEPSFRGTDADHLIDFLACKYKLNVGR